MFSADSDRTQKPLPECPGLQTLASLPPLAQQPLNLPLVTWSNLPAKNDEPFFVYFSFNLLERTPFSFVGKQVGMEQGLFLPYRKIS